MKPLSILALLASTACPLACGLAESNTTGVSTENALAEAAFRRPWDFVYVYPDAATLAERGAMLSLSDLGLGQAFFDAALGHMRRRFAVPGSTADDAPVSPADPTIVHEACLADMTSWRVTQVRFAPYEVGMPGTISAYQAWAARKGSRLDRVISVRLSAHPFCENDAMPGRIDREDQAIHLVYTVAPSDAALTASVFSSAAEFKEKQFAGTDAARSASYAALETHRAALASPAYTAFRREVLSDWATLARSSGVADEAFAALDAQAASFRAVGVAPFKDHVGSPNPPVVRSFAHPALEAANSAFRPALRAMVEKYARPERLARAALMFTVGSQDPLDDFQETRWFFSQIKPGRFDKLTQMPPEAASVYGQYSPTPLDTFVAIAHARGVDVVRATTAGFYSESRGALTGPKNVYPSKIKVDGRSVSVKREVDQVDYLTPPALDTEVGHDMPKLPKGDALKAAMDRFANVDVTNATTTGCDRCHNNQNVVRTDSARGWRASLRSESAYQFHMVTAGGGVSLRTVREVDAELLQAQRELSGR
jgi:hypothetical protein